MNRRLFYLGVCALIIVLIFISQLPQNEDATKNKETITYYFSENCQACKNVGPLIEKAVNKNKNKNYSFDLIKIDITTNKGYDDFNRAMSEFKIPKEKMQVPFIVVGNTSFLGEREIKNTFTDFINKFGK